MRFIDALPSVFWMSAAAFVFAYMLAVALTSLVGGDTDARLGQRSTIPEAVAALRQPGSSGWMWTCIVARYLGLSAKRSIIASGSSTLDSLVPGARSRQVFIHYLAGPAGCFFRMRHNF